MEKELHTEYGAINIAKEVIATLAGIATTECFGVVGVVSSRVISDGISGLLGRESLSKGVDVQIRDDELSIRVHIVVGYGTRIATIAQNIMDNVKYVVKKHTSLIVDKVEVNVQDVRILD